MQISDRLDLHSLRAEARRRRAWQEKELADDRRENTAVKQQPVTQQQAKALQKPTRRCRRCLRDYPTEAMKKRVGLQGYLCAECAVKPKYEGCRKKHATLVCAYCHISHPRDYTTRMESPSGGYYYLCRLCAATRRTGSGGSSRGNRGQITSDEPGTAGVAV